MRAFSVPSMALAIFVTLIAVAPGLANAEAPIVTQVRIALSTCPESPVTREVNAALRIELAAMGVIGLLCTTDDSCEPGDGGAVVGVELEACELREGPVLVWVESASGDRSERRVPLDDIMMPARVRAVALSAAELLRAHQTWEVENTGDSADLQLSEPTSADLSNDFGSSFVDEGSAEAQPVEDDSEAPIVELSPEGQGAAVTEALANPGPLPPPPHSTSSMERGFASPLWSVALTGTGFSHGGPAHIGIRGGVAIHMGSRSPFWILADIGLMYGGREDVLGRIDALTATVAATFAYGAQLGRSILIVGPGVEVGWTQGFGRPHQEGVSSANHGSIVSMILAEVRVVLRLRRRFGLSVAINAGAVLSPVDFMSGDQSLVTIEGALFRALLGFFFE